MQLIGAVVCIGTGVVTAFVLAFIFKHTIGMKVSEEDQATGLDKVYWGLETDVEPCAETSSSKADSA
jgi:ammonia channel protein AmtB